jgi:hypothetical protein
MSSLFWYWLLLASWLNQFEVEFEIFELSLEDFSISVLTDSSLLDPSSWPVTSAPSVGAIGQNLLRKPCGREGDDFSSFFFPMPSWGLEAPLLLFMLKAS